MCTGFSTNSILDFSWKWKEEKVIDSLIIKRKKVKEIYRIINNLEKIPNLKEVIGTPRYAFILEYNYIKDTLYFYDFNSEFYKKEAYMTQNNITLKDIDYELRNFFLKHFKNLLKKNSIQNLEVLKKDIIF